MEEIMRFSTMTMIGAFCLMAETTIADEIRVLTGNAVSGPQQILASEFARQTGHVVKITSANPAIIQQKITAREPFELYIIPAQFLRSAEIARILTPGTLKPVARVGVGIAARVDGPTLNFSTVNSFRKLLIDAKVITFSDPSSGGLSSLSVLKVLENLGLTEVVKAKANTRGNGQELVGRGEADFGLYNASEIPRAPNVVLAGLAPRDVQAWLEYDGAVPAANAMPALALAFLNLISDRKAKDIWEKAGIDLAEQ